MVSFSLSIYIMNNNNVKGRFAPSPTGRMHLGNVFSALLSWLSAKSKGGEWLLRIEDIDPQRSRQQWADLIMADLEWLGLQWDEGPYYQSQRGDIYEHYLQQLTAQGMTYPCYCTRADILATQAPHESDGRVVYKGTCRNLPPGTHSGPAAIRMKVPPQGEGVVSFTDGHYGTHTVDLTAQCGDFIVRRKDGAWAYQLAVVVDDALMGINEVVRGRDLLLRRRSRYTWRSSLALHLQALYICPCCAIQPGSDCQSATKVLTWHRCASAIRQSRLSVCLPMPPVCNPHQPQYRLNN